MPVKLKIAESPEDSIEVGEFVQEREINGSELKTLIEVQEAINKKNRRILRGELYQEQLDSTMSISQADKSDKYALELGNFHGLNPTPVEEESQDAELLKEEIKNIVREYFFVIDGELAYTFGEISNPLDTLNEVLGTDFKIANIDMDALRKEFGVISSGVEQNIERRIKSASFEKGRNKSQTIEQENLPENIVSVTGDVEYQGSTYNVMASAETNSIVVYGVSDSIKAAEIAIDLISRQ